MLVVRGEEQIREGESKCESIIMLCLIVMLCASLCHLMLCPKTSGKEIKIDF